MPEPRRHQATIATALIAATSTALAGTTAAAIVGLARRLRRVEARMEAQRGELGDIINAADDELGHRRVR